MVREICTLKSHKLVMADPGKTLRITIPILHLFPEPELSVQILHKVKRKEGEKWKKRGREAWLEPTQAILWIPLSVLKTKAQPWQ